MGISSSEAASADKAEAGAPDKSELLLQRIAERLRGVRSRVEFSNMDGEVAYYSALNTIATCIEETLSGRASNSHP